MAAEDCFQVASNVFKDRTWILCTTGMPDLHHELAESRPLPLKECQMGRAKMKEKCDSLKKRLHAMILACEKKW